MDVDIESAVRNRWLVAAHRGARSLAPENSLEAARLALAAGARMWEIDVRMSRDGEIVLLHDPDLKRTSDAQSKFPGRDPWLVDDFTLDELRSLDFGSWFAKVDPFGLIAAGEITPTDLAKYSGSPLVTLKEAIVFTISNDWLLNIEIKDSSGRPGNESIVEKLLIQVKSLGADEKVLISSFNRNYLARIKKLEGNIRTGVLVNRSQPDPAALMAELDAFTFNPGLRAFCPRQIRRLKQKGYGVLVWVINNPWLARAYFMMGADGIFTDFPQRFSRG
ncbi:MAG TPA: glycerophosphodiester phosphodiesterase family protein [Syntrophobacteraceae bacterium]|nr:glycerophosphodiester phosphodiesterase family protein [Syntrophobacteraceae bacterium]